MAGRRGKGEGCISKREDGTWQGYVTVGYDTVTKKSKKKYFSGKTRKGVQEKINEVVNKVNAGTYKEPSKMKVAEWFNIWIDEYKKNEIRPTTWESYKVQIDRHILPSIGHLHLSQLQTYHLQSLYNEKLKSGRSDAGSRKGKKCDSCKKVVYSERDERLKVCRFCGEKLPDDSGLSTRSVRYIHMISRACLEQAKVEGHIIVNPADATKPPTDRRKDIVYLDGEQVKLFLKVAAESKHFAALFLALNTGLRRGELLGLRWKDVDLKEKCISVNQSLVYLNGTKTFQEPKTKNSKRTIGISQIVVDYLKEHKKKQSEEKMKSGSAYNKKHGLVFADEIGEPLCPNNFVRYYKRILKSASLPEMSLHGLRHTFATLSLQQGTDPRTIQEALGHHKVAFTLDVYTSVTSKMKQEATDKIGALLASCLT